MLQEAVSCQTDGIFCPNATDEKAIGSHVERQNRRPAPLASFMRGPKKTKGTEASNSRTEKPELSSPAFALRSSWRLDGSSPGLQSFTGPQHRPQCHSASVRAQSNRSFGLANRKIRPRSPGLRYSVKLTFRWLSPGLRSFTGPRHRSQCLRESPIEPLRGHSDVYPDPNGGWTHQ